MNKSPANSPTSFGFISIDLIEGLGHCGGLLIVSGIGRPIEFHCSAPVATNRAHKILYGETYSHFLYCEQIGLSLIDQSKTRPKLYLANCPELLGLNAVINTPVVVLENDANRESLHAATDSPTAPQLVSFQHHDQTIWCESQDSQTLATLQTLTHSFTTSLSLDEPFERIQKAIDEAQAVTK